MLASLLTMKHVISVGLLLASSLPAFCQSQGSAETQSAQPAPVNEAIPPESNNYSLGRDSLPDPTVHAGRVFKFNLSDSKIYPGTQRTITVYVPAAYTGDKPACVYVGLDSLSFNAPTVFDNLIAQHAMPVTIGIGISPGTVDSSRPPANPRFDRSFEFDSRTDLLVRFVLEEVIPAVEQHRTPDGDPIRLSADPNDRAVGGASTGAIAAFTVAWERPDAFRRVFSSIGTYVGMRGGEQYYVLVRKTEPKPLRIFMQDGVHDEWGGGPEMGDWWMSNLTMNRALEFAGYDVRHVWGAGSHNGNQAASVFPDAMRWLWRDWPAPIPVGQSGNPVLQAILQPGESWQVAEENCGAGDLAADPQGKVHFLSGSISRVEVVSADKPASCQANNKAEAIAFGAAGELYRARLEGGIAVTDPGHPGERAKILAGHLHVRNLIVRSNGDIYATNSNSHGSSEVWLITAAGEESRLDSGLKGASGIALSPDGLWLFVAQAQSRSGLSYRVKADHSVDARAPFYDFYVPAWADDSGASAISMDRDGRAYVATTAGVEVFDRNGRVAAILPLPGNAEATGICFGGSSFDTLYVAAGGKIYKRKLHSTGAPPWLAPFGLPKWDAG